MCKSHLFSPTPTPSYIPIYNECLLNKAAVHFGYFDSNLFWTFISYKNVHVSRICLENIDSWLFWIFPNAIRISCPFRVWKSRCLLHLTKNNFCKLMTFFFFFIFYLAASQVTLGHFWGDSFTNPMLITVSIPVSTWRSLEAL